MTRSSNKTSADRRLFIGGSDARIIMSADETALIRLWREKRGEAEPDDLSDNLVVQLGVATEALNRTWYERNTGRAVTDVQRWARHPVHRWMAATLDGFVEDVDAVFEAKFMLPWSFSEEAAAEKHMAQLQHNMWVVNARTAALSIITGGGNGSRWPYSPIRSTSIFSSPLSAGSGAASRPARPLVLTALNPRGRGPKRFESLNERVQFVGAVRRSFLRDAFGLP